MRYDLLLVGVGGQGIITISEILATAAISKGIKAIVTQDRGLAQRGGSVKAHVRLGNVYSPTIPKYSAHAIISLEMREILGYIDYINKDTILLISTKSINYKGVLVNEEEKLDKEEIKKLLNPIKNHILFVDVESKTKEMGMTKGANIYMLGIIFGLDAKIKKFITKDEIMSAIKKLLRNNIEANLELFNEGIRFGINKKIR
jgi:indolepyruvate ferredoxin oxidoreductase beta subunit